MAASALRHSARLCGPDRPGHDGKGRYAAAAGLALAAVFACSQARAGAWPVPAGETLAILKYEGSRADEYFDDAAARIPMDDRADDAISLYVERGLTDRLTFQGRAGWTRGEDGFADYAGRGPLELGLRYALLRDDRSVLSLYLGGALAGDGRNAGYAAPGAGGADLEVRVLAGRSMAVAGRDGFLDVQLARLNRAGLPDETHLDLTLGVEPSDRWLFLGQVYAGQAEQSPVSPLWLKLEISAVRRVGDWRLQAGWRQSVAGRESPLEGGPVFAVWRSF